LQEGEQKKLLKKFWFFLVVILTHLGLTCLGMFRMVVFTEGRLDPNVAKNARIIEERWTWNRKGFSALWTSQKCFVALWFALMKSALTGTLQDPKLYEYTMPITTM
jgi:hypothetical protein